MYCPVCRDEFRSGFTRCASCNADLVEHLPAPAVAMRDAATPAAAAAVLRLVDYCGFFTLDEARQARDLVRTKRIRSEVAIREAPTSDLTRPIEEEYWLRVDALANDRVTALLGIEGVQLGDDDETALRCSSCGNLVAAEETFCARCGSRFETG